MAFWRALRASAREPARPGPGVGVLLRLPSLLFAFRLMPESRGCRDAGFLAAMGRFAGGWGGGGFRTPFWAGGGGGGGRAACSSTYAAGTQAWPLSFFASHQPRESELVCVRVKYQI